MYDVLSWFLKIRKCIYNRYLSHSFLHKQAFKLIVNIALSSALSPSKNPLLMQLNYFLMHAKILLITSYLFIH